MKEVGRFDDTIILYCLKTIFGRVAEFWEENKQTNEISSVAYAAARPFVFVKKKYLACVELLAQRDILKLLV